MKHLFFAISFAFSFNTIAQSDVNRTYRVELSAIPLLYFNYGHIGFSSLKNRNEHAVYLSSWFSDTPPNFNLNLSYNYNRHFKKQSFQHFYLPFWSRASNTRRIVGFEEGYFPHLLRFSAGSGIGFSKQLFKRLDFRTELGIGASLNLTNDTGDMFPLRTNFNEYVLNEEYPITPTVRFKIGVCLVLGKTTASSSK